MTWIKQNPDSCELLAIKNIKNLTGKIDFFNPRILCFAQEYSINDKCLALSLGAELWKYRYYENGTLVVAREEEPEQLIKTQSKGFKIEKVKKESKQAKSVEQHFQGASEKLKNLFNRLDTEIQNISSEVERYTTNSEIIYKTSMIFVNIAVQNKNDCLRLLLRTTNDNMLDEKHLTENVPKTHGWGNITRQVHFSPKDEEADKYTIDDIMNLIHQSYESTQ